MLFALLKFSIALLLLTLLVVLSAHAAFSTKSLALLDVQVARAYEVHLAFLFSDLSQFLDYNDEAVGVKGSIMLLAEPEGTVFPIRHLLAFAHIHAKDFFADFG